MRIAIFADFFYPEQSGITDSVTLLARELSRHGHAVLLVVPHYSRANYRQLNLPATEPDYGKNVQVARLPSVTMPFSPTGQGRLPLPIGFGVAAVKHFRPDIIHSHSPFGPGLEALVASRIFSIPLVGTNHTPFAEFLPKFLGPIVTLVLYYSSWYYNHCQYVTTPSQVLLDDMRKYGLKSLGQALSNPVDIASFSPVASSQEKLTLKTKFGLSPHTVLYTGRLAPEKHIDVIIRAIAKVKSITPNISFALTGRGNAEQALKNLTKHLGLEEQVKFFGFVDNRTFSLLYQASDIFAVMSTAESQCLSLIQGMASGLPVIGANSWALPEYIKPESGLVVPVGDENKLAEAIGRLIANPDYSAKLGRGGVEQSAQYAAKNVVAVWEKIYENQFDHSRL